MTQADSSHSCPDLMKQEDPVIILKSWYNVLKSDEEISPDELLNLTEQQCRDLIELASGTVFDEEIKSNILGLLEFTVACKKHQEEL